MKRLFTKGLYVFMMLPLLLGMSGCDMPFAQIDMEDDMLLAQDAIPTPIADVEPQPTVKPENTKANADKKVEEKSEIDLSNKSAVFDIDAGGRITPFVPYRERNLTYSSLDFGDLPLPPNSGEMDEVLSSLVSAKVTGILYDEVSPSAIINVLEDDYLVKPGDIVESFKIESITKDYVAIKTGSNVYRAKVGDIVDGELYGTGVYNLGHRFAGTFSPANDEDVLIIETKKKGKEEEKKKADGFSDLALPPAPELKLKTPAGEIPLPFGTTPPAPVQ